MLLLANGCVSYNFQGQSLASQSLKQDTAAHLVRMAKYKTKCNTHDSIETQTLAVNPPGTGGSSAAQKYGSVDERWTINLCGQSVQYNVIYVPDGQGGTYFNTSEVREPATQ